MKIVDLFKVYNGNVVIYHHNDNYHKHAEIYRGSFDNVPSELFAFEILSITASDVDELLLSIHKEM